MTTEASDHADFSAIRYAQVWEDADVLLEALDVQPGDTCLSIASAGDNALALLTRDPGRVIAVDLNPAQLACLKLRIAAYQTLEHEELLTLIGSRNPEGGAGVSLRRELYQRCSKLIDESTRRFWNAHPQEIDLGIGTAGKFERYFSLFRRFVLPLVHRRATVNELLQHHEPIERRRFYHERWNTRRWRLLFKLFFLSVSFRSTRPRPRFLSLRRRLGRRPDFSEGGTCACHAGSRCERLPHMDPHGHSRRPPAPAARSPPRALSYNSRPHRPRLHGPGFYRRRPE